MYRTNLKLRAVLGLTAALVLGSCSKNKADSANIDLSFLPESPIVITADTKVRGVDVKGAYFKFNTTITNSSSMKLRIVGVEVKVYPPGSLTPKLSNFDPGTAATTAASTCSFDTFGTWDPAESKPLRIEDTTALSTCSGIAPPFYVESIPTTANQGSFRYRVVVRPIGYFLDGTEESGRFTRTFTFYTR